jgi:hypothetical protein
LNTMNGPYGQPPPPGGYGAPPPQNPNPSPYGVAPYAPAAVAHGTTCVACHQHAPTQYVTIWQNIGALVMRFHKKISGNLCRNCIDKYFWEYTLITFFFGWWGIISFFFTLFILPSNLVTFLSTRKLPRA